MTCPPHTIMPDGAGLRGNASHLAWTSQADWFRANGYRIRRCPGCHRFALVFSSDGRRVVSFAQEFRMRRAVATAEVLVAEKCSA